MQTSGLLALAGGWHLSRSDRPNSVDLQRVFAVTEPKPIELGT